MKNSWYIVGRARGAQAAPAGGRLPSIVRGRQCGNRRAAPALLVLALLALGRGAAANPGLDARELVGVERCLDFEVARQSGGEAILMRARFDTAIRAGIEEVIATLWDFEGSPGVFSRIESSLLLADDSHEALTEQTTAIRALGRSYVSVARFLSRVERSADGEATVSFELAWSDGSLIASSGGWRLREERGLEGPLTHVEYHFENIVPKSLSGQEFIMRNFGKADVARTLRELVEAVERVSMPRG